MNLFDYLFVKVLCSDFVFNLVRDGHIMKVSFEFSHFFSVFFFRLGLEFDDFSDGIDEVAEGHAADNFYY